MAIDYSKRRRLADQDLSIMPERSRLRFIRIINTGKGARALYACSCGTLKSIRIDSVKSGAILSCGCFHSEVMTKRIKHGEARRSAPLSSEYSSWMSMRDRCNNTQGQSYRHYGGRGITVCPRWDLFEQFLADMGRKPDPSYEIERVDNSKGYEPANCIWATRKEQTRNTRRTVIVEHDGKRMCLKDWASLFGIAQSSVIARIRRGWSPIRALMAPVRTQYRQIGRAKKSA